MPDIHTTGGVVTPAQALLVVVPDKAQVTAEVQIENQDIGFVHEGQEAEIKFDAFPATLQLGKTSPNVEGKQVRLSPGMTLTVEVKTGKRLVIDYLLSPIVEHAQESLRER